MDNTGIRKDPIVEEVRRARETHAKKFGYDLHAIIRDLKKHERQSDRRVVTLPPKRLRQADAP